MVAAVKVWLCGASGPLGLGRPGRPMPRECGPDSRLSLAHRPLCQGVPASGWEEDEQKEDGCEEG